MAPSTAQLTRRMRNLTAGKFDGGVYPSIAFFEQVFPGAGEVIVMAFTSTAESPAFITAGLAAVTLADIAHTLPTLPLATAAPGGPAGAAARHAAALVWADLAPPATRTAVAAAGGRLAAARAALGAEAAAQTRLALAFDSLAVLAGWQ